MARRATPVVTLPVIYAALLSGMMMYLGIAFLLTAKEQTPPAAGAFYAILGVSAVSWLLSPVLGLLAARSGGWSLRGPAPEQPSAAAAARYARGATAKFVAACACAEVPALLGLVVSILGWHRWAGYALWAASFAMMLAMGYILFTIIRTYRAIETAR